MGAGCFKTSAIIMRAPGASGQLRRSDDWFLFVCPRRKERKKLTKKERKVCRASDWGKGRSAKKRLNRPYKPPVYTAAGPSALSEPARIQKAGLPMGFY